MSVRPFRTIVLGTDYQQQLSPHLFSSMNIGAQCLYGTSRSIGKGFRREGGKEMQFEFSCELTMFLALPVFAAAMIFGSCSVHFSNNCTDKRWQVQYLKLILSIVHFLCLLHMASVLLATSQNSCSICYLLLYR